MIYMTVAEKNKERFERDELHEELLKYKISTRAYNGIRQLGIKSITELINTPLVTFKTIHNVGPKTIKDIESFVNFWNSSYVKSIYEILNIRNIDGLNMNIRKSIVNIISDNYETDQDPTDIIPKIRDIYVDNIITDKGVTLSEILLKFPEKLGVIESILNDLESKRKIEKFEHNGQTQYRNMYPSLKEYLKTLEDCQNKDIIESVLLGATVKEIGNRYNLSETRARRLIIQTFARIPKLKEDRYKYIISRYQWTPELFQVILGGNIIVYNYLNPMQFKGDPNIEKIISDGNVSEDIRLKIENYMNRDKVIINGTKIQKDKHDILHYIVQTYCLDAITTKDLEGYYKEFLKEHNLVGENYEFHDGFFDPNQNNNINNIVLRSFNNRIRHYDFSKITSYEIATTLNLHKPKNIEYSSLKFFKDYPDAMVKWDVRDEYELHDLIEKVVDCEWYKIDTTEIPNLKFSDANRNKQVLELLIENTPISKKDLASKYEEKYGTLSILASNYFKSIEQYYQDGIYTI